MTVGSSLRTCTRPCNRLTVGYDPCQPTTFRAKLTWQRTSSHGASLVWQTGVSINGLWRIFGLFSDGQRWTCLLHKTQLTVHYGFPLRQPTTGTQCSSSLLAEGSVICFSPHPLLQNVVGKGRVEKVQVILVALNSRPEKSVVSYSLACTTEARHFNTDEGRNISSGSSKMKAGCLAPEQSWLEVV